MRLGKIEKLLILGGGEVAAELARWSSTVGLDATIFTAPRLVETLGIQQNVEENTVLDGTPVVICDSVDDERIAAAAGDMTGAIALSIGAAWIFKTSHIEQLFKGKLFNLHGTRLPLDRGGGGFSWRIMRGERRGACVIHKVDEGIDTGPVVAVDEFLFPASCRIPADFQRQQIKRDLAFAQSFLQSLVLSDTELTLSAQPEYLSEYWPRLSTDVHGWIDWSWTSCDIESFVSAFDEPYPGARTRWCDKSIRLKSVQKASASNDRHAYQAGIVLRNNGRWLTVATRGGELLIERIEDDMGVSVLNDVKAGDRLYSTADDLASGYRRVAYTAQGLRVSGKDPDSAGNG